MINFNGTDKITNVSKLKLNKANKYSSIPITGKTELNSPGFTVVECRGTKVHYKEDQKSEL